MGNVPGKLRRGTIRFTAISACIVASFGLGFATSPYLLSGQFGAEPASPLSTERYYGLAQSEWEFLRQFDRPLAQDLDESLPVETIRSSIHDDLAGDFAAKKNLLDQRYPDLSAPEQLISYLALRVASSLPVLDSGLHLQRSLEPVLLSPRGNCLHHAVRAAFVMDAFGIPARIVLFSTPPHIMGHAVADLYDPEHKLAALVDTNKKMIFFLRDAEASFFETMLAERDEGARQALIDKIVVVEFPMDLRYFNPSDGHLATWVAGKKPPVVLEQVREDLIQGRVSKTKAAFLDGYRGLFETRTRGDETWWLRVQSLSDYAPIVAGLSGQVPVDNSRIQGIIDSIRDEFVSEKQAASNQPL